MRLLQKLFDDLSRDFDNGTFATHLETTVLPTTMYVGDSVIFIANQADLLKNLNTFRNNLVKLGFVRIKYEFLDVVHRHKSSARATVRWLYLNNQNEAFSSSDLIYYCTYSETGLRIALTESSTPLGDNLSGGLPIT